MTFINMPRRWKLCIAISSILVLCSTGTAVQACYDGNDAEDLRYTLFNPDLNGNQTWWSFFYSSKLHAFEGRYIGGTDEEKLTDEWIAAVGGYADTVTARNCIFGSLTDSAMKVNPFYKQLQRYPAYTRYLKLARQSEDLSGYNQYAWDDHDPAADGEKYETLIDSIRQALTIAKDPFLQKKYAFQLVKLTYYFNDDTLSNTTYAQHFNNCDNPGILDWWAMHYKSMLLEREGKTDSANYLHARVFAHASMKMLVSQQMFSSRNFERMLKLARNADEQADLFAMRAAINAGPVLNDIRQVYTLAPNHTQLPLLIGREINKLEDWLGTTLYVEAPVSSRDYWSERPIMQNWKRDRQYLDQFTAALQHMTALARANPTYYNMAMATLRLMQNNPEAAEAHLTAVHSSDPAQAWQATVLRIIATTQQEDIRKPDVQEKLGRMYHTLLEQRLDKFQSMKILYSLSHYLRYTFANKGLIGLAGLFENYAVNKFCFRCGYASFEYSMIAYLDQHATTTDIEDLITRYNQPKKNALEEVLFKPFNHPYYIYDLLATKHLREGNVPAALNTLRQVPESFWLTYNNALENLTQDPFEVNKELLTGETITSYTRLEILERLTQLEGEASANPATRARNNFLLGNAWYNFTQHAWFMLSYGSGSATPNESVHRIGYQKARLYYTQALSNETNPEQRIKILYMLTLLTEQKAERLMYARQYETLSTTKFYTHRNCLTLRDLTGASL